MKDQSMIGLCVNKILSLAERLDRLSARKLAIGGLAFLGLTQAGVLAYAAETHSVSQKGRAFNVKEVSVGRGDLVKFLNDDEFIHQIYVQAIGFDSPESSPGDTIDVRFQTAGTFEVRCHIHPKMSLRVTVQ